MNDSENSRTLPSSTCASSNFDCEAHPLLPFLITRRNLLSVTAKILTTWTAKLERMPNRKHPGPTSAARLWQNWHETHQRRVRITKHRQKLEPQILRAAGGFPIVELPLSGHPMPVKAHSFTEINRWKSELSPEQLTTARSELGQRRKQWKAADEKLGYSPTLAFERDLAEQEGMLSRILWLAKPRTTVEVTAKLHCLLTMEDAGIKSNDAPWPQLRTMLEDLIRQDDLDFENGCRQDLACGSNEAKRLGPE